MSSDMPDMPLADSIKRTPRGRPSSTFVERGVPACAAL
jgi:hypothetical protein